MESTAVCALHSGRRVCNSMNGIMTVICFCFVCRFTCQKSFRDVLNEVNDQAGQHEVVAENLTSAVTKEIVALVKDFKEDRKRVGRLVHRLALE